MPTIAPPTPRSREPIFNVPGVIVAGVLVLVGIHLLRMGLSSEADLRLMLDFAFVPAVWTVAADPQQFADVLRGAAAEGLTDDASTAFARFVLSEVEPAPYVVLTYALLHGSWGHVLLNSLWLAAFGTPVARRCGSLRFAVLAIAAAVAGAGAHFLAHPASVIPMVGASAAVSGMMAAATRFVFTPVPWDPSGLLEAHRRPRQSLAALLGNRRALLFVGIWFAVNLVFGLAAVPLGLADGGIAWEAHIGGFLVGLLLFPLVDPPGPAIARMT